MREREKIRVANLVTLPPTSLSLLLVLLERRELGRLGVVRRRILRRRLQKVLVLGLVIIVITHVRLEVAFVLFVVRLILCATTREVGAISYGSGELCEARRRKYGVSSS